jgi:SAM-dependent methyltransferase
MPSPDSESRFFALADPYERFMGRYSRSLAPEFARVAQVAAGERVLDVGCGTGALTAVLADAVGAERVAAVDPSEPFVNECRRRVPGGDVRVGPAEALPFEAQSFDRALSQLVFHFVSDPAKAVREMARVVRPGGSVAACVWDMNGGMTLLSAYWRAVKDIEPGTPGEETRFGVGEGQLAELWTNAGLRNVEHGAITSRSEYESFDELWESFLGGIGPAGAHACSLDAARRDAVRAALYRRVGAPQGAFELTARAWYAVGSV